MNVVDAFSPYFAVQQVQICAVGMCKGMVKLTQLRVVPGGRLSLTRSVSSSRSIAGKEYGTHLTHCRRFCIRIQKHVTAVCAIHLHSSIDEYQINSPNLDTPMDTITDLLKV